MWSGCGQHNIIEHMPLADKERLALFFLVKVGKKWQTRGQLADGEELPLLFLVEGPEASWLIAAAGLGKLTIEVAANFNENHAWRGIGPN